MTAIEKTGQPAESEKIQKPVGGNNLYRGCAGAHRGCSVALKPPAGCSGLAIARSVWRARPKRSTPRTFCRPPTGLTRRLSIPHDAAVDPSAERKLRVEDELYQKPSHAENWPHIFS